MGQPRPRRAIPSCGRYLATFSVHSCHADTWANVAGRGKCWPSGEHAGPRADQLQKASMRCNTRTMGEVLSGY